MTGLILGLIIGLMAIGVGLRLLSRLPLLFWERVAFGGAIGFGLLAYSVALLAALHWLNGFWLLLALLTVGGLWGWGITLSRKQAFSESPLINGGGARQFLKTPSFRFPLRAGGTELGSPREAGGTHRRGATSHLTMASLLIVAGWCLVGAILLMGLVLCLLPPDGNEWDALAYHLAFPRIYLQAGGMIEIPFMHQSYFPPLLDMLYLLGLWLSGESCAKVFHWWMAVLMVVGTGAFVQRLGGQSLWSALLLMGTPLIVWQSFSAYIDLSSALYIGLGAFALYGAMGNVADTPPPAGSPRKRWEPPNSGFPCQQGEPNGGGSHKAAVGEKYWLWLAGGMMGLALATKYTALLSWGLWGLIALLWCWRKRKWAGMRLIGVAALLALIIGAPWYLRNWYWTGNPVYPFAYEIFGGKNWSREQARAYRGDQLKFGMGREPAQLLMLPWNLTAHPLRFADPIGATVGEQVYLLPTIGMGYLATVGLMVGTGLAPGTGWLLALATLNTLGWFYMMQQVRYLMVVLPLLAAVGTAWAHRASRWLRLLYGALLTVQALYTLWLFGSSYLPLLPMALRDREAYLERRLQIYPAIRFLNTQTPADVGVILLDETRGYYLNRPYMWGNAGHHRLIPYERFQSWRELVDWLRRAGYRYVLINTRFAPQGVPESWRALYYDAIQHGGLQPVFEARGVVIYTLSNPSDLSDLSDLSDPEQ